MSFQSDDGRCGGATYEATDDEYTVSVNNTEIGPSGKDLWKKSYLLGKAVQTDPESFPNAFSVSFNFENKFINFFANVFRSGAPNYYVAETDYDSYVLGIYSTTIISTVLIVCFSDELRWWFILQR